MHACTCDVAGISTTELCHYWVTNSNTMLTFPFNRILHCSTLAINIIIIDRKKCSYKLMLHFRVVFVEACTVGKKYSYEFLIDRRQALFLTLRLDCSNYCKNVLILSWLELKLFYTLLTWSVERNVILCKLAFFPTYLCIYTISFIWSVHYPHQMCKSKILMIWGQWLCSRQLH